MIYPEEGLKNPERWSEQCEEWEVASRRMSQKQVWRGQIGALDGCIIGMDSIGDMDYHCVRDLTNGNRERERPFRVVGYVPRVSCSLFF